MPLDPSLAALLGAFLATFLTDWLQKRQQAQVAPRRYTRRSRRH